MQDSIFGLQAALCGTMSNATRLRIVHALRDRPLCVKELAQALRVDSSKVSQHLAVLKSSGIVVGRRRGSEVLYQITNRKIGRICDLMREVLAEQAKERSFLVEALLSSQ